MRRSRWRRSFAKRPRTSRPPARVTSRSTSPRSTRAPRRSTSRSRPWASSRRTSPPRRSRTSATATSPRSIRRSSSSRSTSSTSRWRTTGTGGWSCLTAIGSRRSSPSASSTCTHTRPSRSRRRRKGSGGDCATCRRSASCPIPTAASRRARSRSPRRSAASWSRRPRSSEGSWRDRPRRRRQSGVAAAPELDPARLTSVAAGAVGRSVDAVDDVAIAPLGYTVFNPVSQGIYRVTGTARSGAAALAWSAVLKICRAPSGDELAQATDERRQVLLDTLRWDREGEAYASGLFETLPRGLAAPRCFGVERREGTLWIWLEHVADNAAHWGVERYALAARHLGRLGGEYLAGRALPTSEWLSRGWVRSWSS